MLVGIKLSRQEADRQMDDRRMDGRQMDGSRFDHPALDGLFGKGRENFRGGWVVWVVFINIGQVAVATRIFFSLPSPCPYVTSTSCYRHSRFDSFNCTTHRWASWGVLGLALIVSVMDDVFQQRGSTNLWDRIHLQRYRPQGQDHDSPSAPAYGEDQHDMDLDDGLSGGISPLIEEPC